MKHRQWVAAVVVSLSTTLALTQAPAPNPAPTPPAATTAPAPQANPAPQGPTTSAARDTPVPGITRPDDDTIAIALTPRPATPTEASGSTPAGPPPALLNLHDFSFEGQRVLSSKLHFKQLSPGVIEITSLAYSLGEWQFQVRDAANYYGLGERFDVLNHAHTIVNNASQDNAHAKGASTYKPMPFYLSTTGYGLWVDTTAEAQFDLNATSTRDIQVYVPAEKLRIVVFTTPGFPRILEQFTALTQRAILPPYWAFAPWMGRDYHQNQAQVLEDVEKTRALGLPASVILIDSPWTTAYNSYKFNPKQFDDAPAMVKSIHEPATSSSSGTPPGSTPSPTPPKKKASKARWNPARRTTPKPPSKGYFVKQADGRLTSAAGGRAWAP